LRKASDYGQASTKRVAVKSATSSRALGQVVGAQIHVVGDQLVVTLAYGLDATMVAWLV
jgi:hypothetical protein